MQIFFCSSSQRSGYCFTGLRFLSLEIRTSMVDVEEEDDDDDELGFLSSGSKKNSLMAMKFWLSLLWVWHLENQPQIFLSFFLSFFALHRLRVREPSLCVADYRLLPFLFLSPFLLLGSSVVNVMTDDLVSDDDQIGRAHV